MVGPPVTPAKTLAASTEKVSELFVGRAGVAGLLDSCHSPGSAADRRVFPVRIPHRGWKRVNTFPAGRVNDVRGGTVPLQGEFEPLDAGLDLFTVEAARYVVEPGWQRFRDCSETPVAGGWTVTITATTPPGATVLGICPWGVGVRRRNQRDLPFRCCALGIPRISRRTSRA